MWFLFLCLFICENQSINTLDDFQGFEAVKV